MNILCISSILPVPGIIPHNDFVFQYYLHYREIYDSDRIVIIKPIKIDLNLLHALKGEGQLRKLRRKYSRDIHGFRVEIFPFISSWGLRNLHALLTSSIYFLNRRRIKNLFSEFRFNVIHAHYIFSDGMLAHQLHRRYGLSYFITTHNERYYFDHLLSRKIALKILGNAQQVIPINYTNGSYYISLGLNNVEIVPLGFNRFFLKNQKPWKGGPVRIFTASVLIRLKNIDKVILALRDLVARYDLTYTIIGNGPEKDNLQALVRELNLTDKVGFIEHISHLEFPNEMYKYDLFIMPSYFETFGRVFFECMAMGIPVICAKKSGISGLFKEREEGISVNHNSIKEIADALEYMVSNHEERLRIGRNGQKLVSKYTWEYLARDLHERYRRSAGLTD
jgi:teichuronic acid biosynthesis glycosyltransferase TuaC